jgi:RHS repeat-associated protein
VGLVKNYYQRNNSTDYQSTYTYNKADEETTVSYPSGRTVSTSYDGAGRIASMSTSSSSGTVNLSSANSYSPAGALTSELYDNGLIHAIAYNSRMQSTSISLGIDVDPDMIFKLTYLYGELNNPTDPDSAINASKNNGNIARIRLFWDESQIYSQTYRYGSLNHIQDYVVHWDGITDPQHEVIKETYEYDRFGNRGMNNSASTNWGPPLSYFNPANNRFNVAPYSYDNRGNLSREPAAGGGYAEYGYNGDNLLVTSPSGSYTYDGNGRRMTTHQGPVDTRLLVYSASGQLIADYNNSGGLIKEYFYRGGQLIATIDAGGVKYGTPDHLGSVREWTLSSGAIDPDGTHDYTPFGIDFWQSGQYDGQRHQFTGKERDLNNGLDYFGARYFASVQGRFTSPDVPFADQDVFDPQSWNLFIYVRNNPLSFVDPTGRSTHTDAYGNVVAVYHDCDLGVYRHDDLKNWNKKDILSTSGKKIARVGETEYWDEFRAHDDQTGAVMAELAPGAKIEFGTSFDADIRRLNAEAMKRDLTDVAGDSRPGRRYDIKVDTDIAEDGPNTGRLLNGKYATARSAGNYLAGLNGATAKFMGAYITETNMMKLAGALQKEQFTTLNAGFILLGKSYGPPPYYGELELAGRRIQAGFRKGVSMRPKR